MESSNSKKKPPYSYMHHFLSLLVGAVLGGIFALAAGFSPDGTIGAVFIGAILGEVVGIVLNAISGRGAV